LPQDIGIVGFDNIPESGYFWPSLTTVNQDQNHLGRTAVDEIIKIIEAGWNESAPINPKSIMLEPSLLVRESTVRVAQ